MRVVVVGTETAVFQKDSPVRERILAYTKGFASTDIIVLCGPGFQKKEVGNGVVLYPTNSTTRISRVFDAVRIGKKLAHADVVTVQDPFETGLAGRFIARRLGAKLHVQVHTDPYSLQYARHSILNFFRLHLALYILKKADGIRVVSMRVKEEIERRLTPKRPITVLPIFVDVERIRAAVASPELRNRFCDFKTRLLVVARLESEKNVKRAVEAFAKAAPKDACLIIVGSGRERADLEALAQTRGVMGRVFFEGQQDPAPYYALADLVLVTSHYEGYGLVIVEALAAGKPVLSTDVGIAREQGALVAEPGHFADALATWFKSGPRIAHLTHYPYDNFEAYRQAYCDDVLASVTLRVSQPPAH